MRKYRKYENYLDNALKDPERAASYLNTAMEEGSIEVLLLAVADIARSYGMSHISKKADLQREGLYKMLSKKGNPELKSFLSILNASGITLHFQPKMAHA
jgi:probable addiction module antidote protein